MSFVRLNDGEFPPLGKASQSISVKKKQKQSNGIADGNLSTVVATTSSQAQELPIAPGQRRQENFEEQRVDPISQSYDFVKCRVGYQIHDYHENLVELLNVNHVGTRLNFLLIPIEPVRPYYYTNEFEAISDLALSGEDWQSSVAINLGYPSLDFPDPKATSHFDNLFRHALYLAASVIVIDCPESELAYLSVASTVNARLTETRNMPLILFKVPPSGKEYLEITSEWDTNGVSFTQISDTKSSSFTSLESDSQDDLHNNKKNYAADIARDSSAQDNSNSQKNCPWNHWNNIRSHLNADQRIGVCLMVKEDLTIDAEELNRWSGEPVRMIVLHTDQFVQSNSANTPVKLTKRCETFVKQVALANSLKTCFVIESLPKQDVKFHLQYMNYMVNTMKDSNQDYLRPWDDKIQPPLQPLSMNLDSTTYQVFESDRMKYLLYRHAMVEALDHLISQNEGLPNRQFILMVLGAGRGPLVDEFIEAIKEVNTEKFKYKLFALDKNRSSVRSLKHKSKTSWIDTHGLIEVEVVEHDMRSWEPGVKADIIATELLGSLSDNELSPECLDGVWKFSTPKTISIPQQYTSFVAPICSYKLHQELYRLQNSDSKAYDQIYVVRLSNYYQIDEPQRLFRFEHRDLSLDPSQHSNERYIRLEFWSKVDTVCHGFSGYFSANLFASISLSTLISNKTPNMDSWFPAFIPLENPIQMPKNTKLVLHFWRKESSTKVWYEWVVTHPVRSRIYSLNGEATAMSKCT